MTRIVADSSSVSSTPEQGEMGNFPLTATNRRNLMFSHLERVLQTLGVSHMHCMVNSESSATEG